jgi:hypothetical protein
MAPHLTADGILCDYSMPISRMAMDAKPQALRRPVADAAAVAPAALDAEPTLTMAQAFKHFDRLK